MITKLEQFKLIKENNNDSIDFENRLTYQLLMDFDAYRWKDREHGEFWYLLTKFALRANVDTNPNAYLTELPEDVQKFIVDIAKEMYKSEKNN